MSDPYDDDLQDDSSGSRLRQQLEQALKDKKAAETERDAARRDLAVHVTQGVLKDKGYKSSAASWAAKDGVDLSDEEALNTWLEGPGQDFKLPESDPQGTSEQQQQQQQDSPPPAPNGQPSFGSPHVQTHNDVMAQLRAEASPEQVSKFQQVLNSLPETATGAEVDAAFRNAGL